MTERAYYESLVADDEKPNIIGVYTDGSGDVVVMVPNHGGNTSVATTGMSMFSGADEEI